MKGQSSNPLHRLIARLRNWYTLSFCYDTPRTRLPDGELWPTRPRGGRASW